MYCLKKRFSFLVVVLLILSNVCHIVSANGMEVLLKKGTYYATRHGHHSDVKVAVTLSENSIDNIEIVESNETFNLSDAAITAIPSKILQSQSVNVDSVTGATFTSWAIINAVKDCIKQAGGDEAVTAFSKKAEELSSPMKEYEIAADVIVVGSGAAGMAAALNAQREGAKVVVIEKLDFFGGISQTMFGGMVLPLEDESDTNAFRDYHVNKAAGIMQGEEYLVNDLYPIPSMIQTYIDNTQSMIEWLDEVEIPHTPLEPRPVDGGAYMLGGMLVRYDEVEVPNHIGYMLKDLVDRFVDNNGEIYLSTKADSLIYEDGRVVGVKATGKDGSYTFRAKNTILATGGFGASQAMIKEYAPEYKGDMNVTLPGNTGDGIRMALEVGAVMYDNQTMMSGSGHLEMTDADMISPYSDSLTSRASLFLSPGGLRLNSEDPYSYALGATFVNPDGQDYYWIINNQEIAKEAGYLELIEKRISEGNPRFYKSDSIANLANQIRITPNTLRYSLNRYNAMCDAGEDKDFGKSPEFLKAMKEGPWYAVRANIVHFGTVGGIVTNQNAEVVDANNVPIPGLFAAGEISNHGLNHLCYAQNQFGACLIMGMIAGRNAAK